MSRFRTKPTKWYVHPAKTQISLGIHPVWSESSLCAQWVAKDPSFLHADSEDSDQTGWMPRLIRVFAGRTCHFVGFVMRWLICFAMKLTITKTNTDIIELSHAKINKMTCASAKTQISLGISPVWSVSSLCTLMVAKDQMLPNADSKDSDQTGPRQANLVLIAYASSEGSGEPAHPRSLARTSAARSYK